MFKTLFNSLAIEVENFILERQKAKKFNDSTLEVLYYRNIVDIYHELLFNINNIQSNITDKNSNLLNEVIEYKNRLINEFSEYKDEIIVSYYLKELQNKETKNYFFNVLFDFEKSLVNIPFEFVTESDVQNILTKAREYTKNAQSYYFFTNNPYVIDETFKITVPNKVSADSEEQLISKLFTYLNSIFTIYKTQNVTNILEFKQYEQLLLESLSEFDAKIQDIAYNKLIIDYDTTGKNIYDYLNNITNDFELFKNKIVEQNIYRIKILNDRFNIAIDKFEKFKETYASNNLLQDYYIDLKFDEYLKKFQDYIHLIEDGKINLNKSYIITEFNLKELTDVIITLSKEHKKTITYTVKYTNSGKPETLLFNFYQIDKFLSHIKEYYYNLATNALKRDTSITVDDFGDNSVDDLREEHKRDLAIYDKYIMQDTEFMNMYEFDIYLNNLLIVQNKLKKSTVKFIENAVKSSPMTFTPIISNYYKTLTNKLKTDIEQLKKSKQINLNIAIDNKQSESIKKLNQITEIISNIYNAIDLSKRYVFLNIGDFIEREILLNYNNFFNELKILFAKNAFNEFLSKYEIFYVTNILDFNMLFSLEKLTVNAEKLFTNIDKINSLYIDEQLNDTYITNNDTSLEYLDDLFNDSSYKGVRYELSTALDDFYNYMIENRKNEYTFLVNEKNLKKIYIDNQLIKINYIRLFNLLMKINNDYADILKDATTETYQISLDIIKKLNTLILQQNKIISELNRTIMENRPNNTFIESLLTMDYDNTIVTANKVIEASINDYKSKLLHLTALDNYKNTSDLFVTTVSAHLTEWQDIICKNQVKDYAKISYNDQEIIQANIPLTVTLDAKMEYDANNDIPEFIWDFGEEIIKVGKKIKHTFYNTGLKTVICEMKYPSGLGSTRVLQFDLKPPTNSQLVKSGKKVYTPLNPLIEQPKITFKDPLTQLQVTVPITVKGNISDMITNGNILIGENNERVLLKEKIGYVILGFEGVVFAGPEFDYKTIFSDTFELPTETEFLFDFNISDPIVNKSIINISQSKFIDYIAKVPKEKAQSVYEIVDASIFQPIDGDTIEIIPTDILIMKNKSGRYMVLEVANINEITVPTDKKYYFEFEFNYYVNISLNTFEKTTFSPLSETIDIPTVVFNTNTRELFNTMVIRLEEIKALKESLLTKKDNEYAIVINKKIEEINNNNKSFFIFEELEKLKAKVFLLQSRYDDFISLSTVTSIDQTDIITEKTNYLKKQLSNSITFSEYMNSIDAYDFRANIVDLNILLQFYNDEINSLQLLIYTFDYASHNIDFYIKMYNNLKFIPKLISKEDFKGNYIFQVIQIVKLIRDHLFKIKIIINFPIMNDGKYINFSESFKRLQFDFIQNKFVESNETDFYLFNKKIELLYGLEISKVENGLSYTKIIEDVVKYTKELFGTGSDDKYISELGTYIQEIESNVIDEYDNYFMIPFWIDYLEKLS